MKIGILTFYRVANFGANLQAVSTFCYLKKHGHEPMFILYESEETTKRFQEKSSFDIQKNEHVKFVDTLLNGFQSRLCNSVDDVNSVISDCGIEAIIIGSDAVLQHHPLITRIHKGKRKPFYIGHVTPERTFPNVFWGVGIDSSTPVAMMSVSSQNSGYRWFGKSTRHAMAAVLQRVSYISVRDSWTKKMVESILPTIKAPITPDPVFAFNYNAEDIIPDETNIRQKFRLPQKYILVSLHGQHLTTEQLDDLKMEFRKINMECVAFPMPTGIKFSHNFDYEVNIPLSPIDWYALIKYSSAYVGSNMHPIVVSLHNAVPCFSIDNWGLTDFWGKKKNDGSSKVLHILSHFGVQGNHSYIQNGKCSASAVEIVEKISSFPKEVVRSISEDMMSQYKKMMEDILNALVKDKN